MVAGIELSKPKRVDECCGFGGTFCVFEEAVSAKMGRGRIAQHESNGVEYITGVNVSCLMHMEGILKRKGIKVKTIHIAEILNADSIARAWLSIMLEKIPKGMLYKRSAAAETMLP